MADHRMCFIPTMRILVPIIISSRGRMCKDTLHGAGFGALGSTILGFLTLVVTIIVIVLVIFVLSLALRPCKVDTIRWP